MTMSESLPVTLTRPAVLKQLVIRGAASVVTAGTASTSQLVTYNHLQTLIIGTQAAP